MTLKQSVRKTLQRSRVLRYKAYKKVGVSQHRKKIDLSFFLMFMLCAATFPFFIIPTAPLPEMAVEQPVQKPEVHEEESKPDAFNQASQEMVHPDLGDAPVIEAHQASLAELEKKVQLDEMSLDMQALRKGGSVLALLSDEKIPVAERMDIVESLELIVDLKSLKPGLMFMLFKDKDNRLMGLSLQMDDGETLAVLREEDDSWTPFTAAGRIETEVVRKQGTVEKTFSGSALKNGIPDSVIAQITSALDGELDFKTDIQPGDSFDVIFEIKKTSNGLEIGGKPLLFIGVKTKRKEIFRYAYTDQNGTPSFYDARGRTGEKLFMKRPLKGRSRLSSPYGRRRHPILMYEIFHHGVDLAAPMNTPIVAAADGVITHIGRKGAYGKYIRLRHASGYQSAYGHMNGYRQDLKNGSRVKRGEVIGYLGSTGRSTGPHVHFEIWKNNKTVNPFGRNAIPSRQLSGFELEQFFSYAEQLHPDFAKHRAGKIPPVPEAKPF